MTVMSPVSFSLKSGSFYEIVMSHPPWQVTAEPSGEFSTAELRWTRGCCEVGEPPCTNPKVTFTK